jgi:hypothetical protein
VVTLRQCVASRVDSGSPGTVAALNTGAALRCWVWASIGLASDGEDGGTLTNEKSRRRCVRNGWSGLAEAEIEAEAEAEAEIEAEAEAEAEAGVNPPCTADRGVIESTTRPRAVLKDRIINFAAYSCLSMW